MSSCANGRPKSEHRNFRKGCAEHVWNPTFNSTYVLHVGACYANPITQTKPNPNPNSNPTNRILNHILALTATVERQTHLFFDESTSPSKQRHVYE